ncbi:MAG: hypothetical protein JOY99_11265 [Sphingomonadaceae bacterium]|nr:hypothetical protein [Sphingomonadaceae bacterium]
MHHIKTLGYLVSSISVLLLAIVSWQSAQKTTAMSACLIVGAVTSVTGMFCRWITYELEERKKQGR